MDGAEQRWTAWSDRDKRGLPVQPARWTIAVKRGSDSMLANTGLNFSKIILSLVGCRMSNDQVGNLVEPLAKLRD